MKTANSNRKVELPRELVEALAARKDALAVEPDDGDLVFLSRTGGPCERRTVARALDRAAARAGVEGFTFHGFRHTHGSLLIQNGDDVVGVAARLGDTVATVQETYLHEIESAHRSDARRARLDSIYGSSLEAADHISPPQTAPDLDPNPA